MVKAPVFGTGIRWFESSPVCMDKKSREDMFQSAFILFGRQSPMAAIFQNEIPTPPIEELHKIFKELKEVSSIYAADSNEIADIKQWMDDFKEYFKEAL